NRWDRLAPTLRSSDMSDAMVRASLNLACAISFLLCAAAAVLWPATRTTGMTLAKAATSQAEYRLISGHGRAQLAKLPFIPQTASPSFWEESTRLGCTLTRFAAGGHAGWAASAPLAYPIALFALLPTLRLASWLRKKRRERYRPGLCRHCGYDLRGGHDRCPECGAATTRIRLPSASGASQRPL